MNGEDIFIFWDRKCLNYGQNWEEGFIHGISHSTAIILIISEKVCKDRKAVDQMRQLIIKTNTFAGDWGDLQNCSYRPRQRARWVSQHLWLYYVCSFFIFLFFNHLVFFFFCILNLTKIRYECALLKNISQGTPVIPVFAAEMTPTGDFTPFDIRKVKASLPKVEHKRDASASSMLSNLRYSLSLSPSLPPLDFPSFSHTPSPPLSPSFKLMNWYRGSLPQEKTEFLSSIAKTIDNVSSFPPSLLSSFFCFILSFLAFVSFYIFDSDYKDIQDEWDSPEAQRRGQGGTRPPRSITHAGHAEVCMRKVPSPLPLPSLSLLPSPPTLLSSSTVLSLLTFLFSLLFLFAGIRHVPCNQLM